MGWWCPWYARTGQYVRHKQSGAIGEIVWRTPRGDFEVQMIGAGRNDLVCWFRENVEPTDAP